MNKGLKLVESFSSAAILVQTIRPLDCNCCISVCVAIMVIIAKKDGSSITDTDWVAGTYKEILEKYNHEDVKEYPPIHPVDLLAIATKSDPVPLKDVDENSLDKFHGRYFGRASFASRNGFFRMHHSFD